MFRDESSKVMQKAHAQWGVVEPSELGVPSTASSSTPTSASPTRARPSVSDEAAPSLVARGRRSVAAKSFPKEIPATPVDKAIQFYLEHYVLGLPDEPRFGQELQGRKWVFARETREIMAAVGLAGLSNLTGDKDMSTLARHHYGRALQNMSSAIRNVAGVDLDVVIRAVVMMAMYEVGSISALHSTLGCTGSRHALSNKSCAAARSSAGEMAR